nr:unnamed protein product [Digitaria exilis]
MEMEMAAGECRNNGATEAEEVSDNILLDSGKLGALKRREFVDNLLKHVEDDNLHFLQRQKERIDRQVLFADCIMFVGLKSDKVKINILEGVSGIIKPRRLTLLLGPPGCGKSTLLQALAGKIDKSLKATAVAASAKSLQTEYILKVDVAETYKFTLLTTVPMENKYMQ